MTSVYVSFFFFLISAASCQQDRQTKADESNQMTEEILPGSYRTEAYLGKLRNKRIALVVNQSSKVGPSHLVDTLLSSGIDIRSIFTPEHGFLGRADAGEKVADDMYLGRIPIISLYGSKKKPEKEDLQDIDLLVFDIQDVGVRFYTYASTLHYIMEAAAESGLPVMVLDRPNPNGHYIDGPVREPNYKSFIGMHPVPVVYGMTIGEYATMILGELWLEGGLEVDLEIIPCDNYTHDTRYVLPIAPSPNLPNERSILLYPSLCFFEGTNVSVGRGTKQQFQIFGHPDLDETGFKFTPISSFGAKYPKHQDIECHGVDLSGLDPEEIRDWRLLRLEHLISAHEKLKKKGIPFFKDNDFFEKLAGNASLRQQISQGMSEDQIRATWSEDINAFKKIRQKYLLYPDFTS